MMDTGTNNPRVLGLDNGMFYSIHVPALCSIIISLSCVVVVLVASFKLQNFRQFFSWGKSDRFVVYLAICDGLFNVAHTFDHSQMLITKQNVHPSELCVFYAVMLVEFTTAQTLLVSLIAVNAFVLIRFRKSIDFGKKDWKLLLWTFGIPLLEGVILAILGRLGPTGVFCGVPGKVTLLIIGTVPATLIFTINCVLYGATWYHIRKEAKKISHVIGNRAHAVRGKHTAAKIMMLFVTAFFIQWGPLAIFGIIDFSAGSSITLVLFVVTVTNLGGLFNGLIFLIIQFLKYKKKNRVSDATTNKEMMTKSKQNGSTAEHRTITATSQKNITSETL